MDWVAGAALAYIGGILFLVLLGLNWRQLSCEHELRRLYGDTWRCPDCDKTWTDAP